MSMDRNRANRAARLRRMAARTGDDARDVRRGRPKRLGYGWRTEYPQVFPVTVSRVAAADLEGGGVELGSPEGVPREAPSGEAAENPPLDGASADQGKVLAKW